MSKRKLHLSIAMSLIGFVLVAVLFASHAEQIISSLQQTSWQIIAILVSLQLISYALRAELWRSALVHIKDRSARKHQYAASSLTFLAMNVVHYLSAFLRISSLRKLEPERSPSISKMTAVEVPVALLEMILAAVLLVGASSSLHLESWLVVALVSFVIISAAAMIISGKRLRWEWAESFTVFSNKRSVLAMSLLIMANFALQIARTAVAFKAFSIDLSIAQMVLVFLLIGVASALPLASSGVPLATAAVFSTSEGTAVATAVGLLLVATLFVASIVFAALCWAILYLTEDKEFVDRAHHQLLDDAAQVDNLEEKITPLGAE